MVRNDYLQNIIKIILKSPMQLELLALIQFFGPQHVAILIIDVTTLNCNKPGLPEITYFTALRFFDAALNAKP